MNYSGLDCYHYYHYIMHSAVPTLLRTTPLDTNIEHLSSTLLIHEKKSASVQNKAKYNVKLL